MNEKQRRFVEAYLTTAGGNATKAAKAAGYSDRSAHVIGSRLMKHPDVSQALATRSTDLAAMANLTAAEWAAEIKAMATAKVEISERGKVKALEMAGKQLGILHTKEAATSSGITVNIGFIAPQGVAELPQAVVIETHPISTEGFAGRRDEGFAGLPDKHQPK